MKKKFQCALVGVETAMRHPSVFIQVILGACAIVAGFILHLSTMEWIAVIICIGFVIATEMVNTCIEKICDMYSQEYRKDIKEIKDIAAGAVFVASLIALIVAIIIFVHHLV